MRQFDDEYDNFLIGNMSNKHKAKAEKVIAEIIASRQRAIQLATLHDEPDYLDDYGPAEIIKLNPVAYDMDGEEIPNYFGVLVTHEDFLSEIRREFYLLMDRANKAEYA